MNARKDVRAGWRRRLTARRCALLAALLLACGFALQAGAIHAKAGLAQLLLARAFDASQHDGRDHAPWPWADTVPVARLAVPAHGIEQIVLAGDDGRTLAFGPGWAQASAAPGQHGGTVISGHRDTHFSFLQRLAIGDAIQLENRFGGAAYQVISTQVVDTRHHRLDVTAGDQDTLWLVTCWPFDAVTAGGPMRYLVQAQRKEG